MPEHLRALPVVLLLAAAVFAFAKAPACALASATGDFERRRNLWFGITLTAFLAHNFWIYIVVAAALLLSAVGRESNKLAMFFLLLFAVPPIRREIPGLGVVDHLFSIEYLRLLSLAILLPAFLHLRKQPDTEPFGRLIPDKLLAGYLVLQLVLMLQVNTLTNSLRHGVFYAFLGVFLPYYVASRSLRNLQQFRDALMGFAVAAMVLSAIGAFEYAKGWLLYAGVDEGLGLRWVYGGYMQRGGGLRATASTVTPLHLGYVIAVAVGFFLFLRRSVPNPTAWALGLLLLIVGLIAPVSRGPWVGVVAIALVFIAAGPSPLLGYVKLGLLGAAAFAVLLVTPAGEKIVDLLPFVGDLEQKNVTYREQLAQISYQLIMENPVFGVYDYLQQPELQVMIQGQGIIDVVNTYAGVGMGTGLVGVSLFVGVFIFAAAAIFNGMRNLPDKTGEDYLLGRSLMATLLGIMVMIATVSSTMVIPLVYWSVIGLGIAYARMVAGANEPVAAGTPTFAARP